MAFGRAPKSVYTHALKVDVNVTLVLSLTSGEGYTAEQMALAACCFGLSSWPLTAWILDSSQQ